MIGDRIKLFGISKYGNLSAFARAIGKTPDYLTPYYKNKSKPGSDLLILLYNLGCNINWLLTGEGEMLIGDRASPVELGSIEKEKYEAEIKKLREENKILKAQIDMLQNIIENALISIKKGGEMEIEPKFLKTMESKSKKLEKEEQT